VVERASVVGEQFGLDEVSELGDNPSEPTRQLVGALIRTELISRDLASDDAFRFAHLLIRDAAYAGMLKAIRAELHERFANWLVNRAGDRLAEYQPIVGHHLEQAYRYREALAPLGEEEHSLARRAASHLRAAGGQALGRFDANAAVNLLTRAADLLTTHAHERVDTLLDLASAHRHVGDFDAAGVVARNALHEAASTQSPGHLVRARVELAEIAVWSQGVADGEAATAIGPRDIAVLEAAGDDRALVNLHAWLGIREDIAMRYGPAQRSYRRALEHLRRCSDRRLEHDLLLWCIGTSLILGPIPVTSAVTFVKDCLARAPDQPYLELYGQGTSAGLITMSGDLARGRRMRDEVVTRLQEQEAPFQSAAFGQLAAAIDLLADDPAGAMRHLTNSYEICERLGEQGSRWTTAAMAGEAARRLGHLEEAERWCDLAARHAPTKDPATHIQVNSTRASIRAVSGDAMAALEFSEAAEALTARTDSPESRAESAVARTDALAAAGRFEEAKTKIDAAIADLEAKGNMARARQLKPLRRELRLSRG